MADFGSSGGNFPWEEPRQHTALPNKYQSGKGADVMTFSSSQRCPSGDRPSPVGAAMTAGPAGGLDMKLAHVQFQLESLPTPSGVLRSDNPAVCVAPGDTSQAGDVRTDWATPAVHRQLKHFPASTSAAPSLSKPVKDFDHFEPLIRSKDNILHQKDVTIQRLQREIELLKRQCHESEVRVQQVLRKQVEGDSASLTLRLSESQNDLALAHAEAEQVRKQTEREMVALQATLGKSEYQVEQSQVKIKQLELEQGAHREELKKLRGHQEAAVQDLKTEIEDSGKREEAMKNRVQSLERYLTKVPTPQEVQKSTEALSTWRERCQAAEELSRSSQEIAERKDEEVEKQRSELEQLRAQVSALLQLQSGNVQEQFTSTSSCSREELQAMLLQRDAQCAELHAILERTKSQTSDDMQKVRHRYKQLYARAKAELETECQLLKQHVEELAAALHDEKLSNGALHESVSERQSIITDLRSTTAQLVKQNQELLDHSLQLEDANQQQGLRLRSLPSESIGRVRSVQAELQACVGDLRNLIQVWKSFVDGHDPDMSRLLGLPAPCVPEPSPDEDNEMFVEQLEEQLGDVRTLRTEVDQLRSLLADHYAQELGSSCPVQ